MHVLSPTQINSDLRSLFTTDMPCGLRCFAVLNGDTTGRMLIGDPSRPTWVAEQETVYGTTYFGGDLNTCNVAQVIDTLRRDSDVIIGMWHGDTRFAQLMPQPDYDGEAIDFTDRSGDLESLMRMPDGCQIRQIDAALLRRKSDFADCVASFGSADKALAKGLGHCLMQGETILCETFTGPPAIGMFEVGVETHEPYRRHGYATVACAHLIRACENKGLKTFWNTAKQNTASIALARKLGYRTEQEYRVLAWFKRAKDN